MSAAFAQSLNPQSGIEVTAQFAGQDAVRTPAAREWLGSRQRRIEPQRQALLAARNERQAFCDGGGLPDFREDTRAIREGDWKVAPIPTALLDRRVEITGPVDPKMVINALNSGAKVFMADFEDSTSPTWQNLLTGQRALIGAVQGDLAFTAENGKQYALKPQDEQAVLLVRPSGLPPDEKHVLIDAEPSAGRLFALAAFSWHRARALQGQEPVTLEAGTCALANNSKPRCGLVGYPILTTAALTARFGWGWCRATCATTPLPTF